MLYLALIGWTLVVVRGSLWGLVRLRNLWPGLFKCATCLGVWCGGLGFYVLTGLTCSWRDAFIAAGSVSVGATIVDFVLSWIDSHTSE